MNPYELNLSVIQHIDALVKQSKLSRAKRDDIKRELTAFAEDYGRELHFDGKDSAEIDALVIKAIGNVEQRSKEFMIANQKLSRVPWIGPLFYDDVMRIGAALFLLQLCGLFVLVCIFFSVIEYIVSSSNMRYGIIEAVFFFLWLAYGFCIGIFARLRLKLFWKSFDAAIASIVPILLFFVAFVVSRLIVSYTEGVAFRFDSLYYSIIFLILYPAIFCGTAVPYRIVQKFQRKNRR